MKFANSFQYICAILSLAVINPFSLAAHSGDECLTIDYSASICGVVASGDFTPYYIGVLQGGRFLGNGVVQAEAAACKRTERDKRFSWGAGVDLIAGWDSAIDYERFSVTNDSWYYHRMQPSKSRVQQLYGELKWRGIFLNAGMKERESALVDQRLSSGDLVESGNARPVPQARAGFMDYQDIPLTNGWVQIQGEIGYGKFIDNTWNHTQFNYYNGWETGGEYYNYKRCYFRTRPSAPLCVTVGMQAAGEFGGYTQGYNDGSKTLYSSHKATIKTLVKMLLPMQDGNEGFYTGNHLGSWDFKARYRLRDGHELSGYFQWPFEDGSGIGKLNGWDGLWGIQYKSTSHGIVTGAVVEYLDFTNQSGSIHWQPADYEGTTLGGHASGCDDYYNNQGYRSWANYGFSIGTPALMAPVFNTDGYTQYAANRMRGVHAGVAGYITPAIEYTLKGGFRKAWGNGYFSLPRPIHLASIMAHVSWRPKKITGLTVDASVEIDRGSMPCSATGAMVSLRWDGVFSFK